MSNSLMEICYEGETGSSDIRTCYFDDILHIALKDVLITLNKENRELDERHTPKHLINMIRTQIQDLDSDEYILVPVKNGIFDDEKEVFVTQPGLNRVLSSNKSKAGKKFQRWLYHDVIPSLIKHGVFPPPKTPQGSALSQMAEILAQNSRALADQIVIQEQLANEVESVKSEIGSVSNRLDKLESSGEKFIIPVKERFDDLNLPLDGKKELEVVTWCENLSLTLNRKRIACPSGERLNAKFHLEVIDKAISLVDRANR